MTSIYGCKELKQPPLVSDNEAARAAIVVATTAELSQIEFLVRANNGRAYLVPCVRRESTFRKIDKSAPGISHCIEATVWGAALDADGVQNQPYYLRYGEDIVLELPYRCECGVFTPKVHLRLTVEA